MLYPLIRKFFFSLDAEDAHGIGMRGVSALSCSGLAGVLAKPVPACPVEVMGLKFPNPVGLAAGLDKNGDHIDGLAALGFGFLEIGTITPRPQPGNPRPRLFRIPEKQAIINRMGFNNEGVDRLIANVKAAKFPQRGGILGINIGKNFDTPIDKAADDYLACLERVYPLASYITVNISSPNTKNLRELQKDEALDALLAPLKAAQQRLADTHGRYVPMALKIAPDLEDAQIAGIADLLRRHRTAEDAANAMPLEALRRGSADNATALVADVIAVPSASLRDSLVSAARLPVPPRLRIGQELDGLRVEELLHESRATLLYRVSRPSAGGREDLVLKTLLPEAGDDEAIAALVHEEWLARRVLAPCFPQVIGNDERSHLYYLMTWHSGQTLKAGLARGHRYAPHEVAELGVRLLKGVGALHRLGILHRDIKPDNLHRDAAGMLRILDLGVAASDGEDRGERFREINNPGTPSYMAPELFEGRPASESSDLYACGVTLYELLTRKYPYGEVEPFQNPRFGNPVPPTRYRPDLPDWLEAVLLKACARDPAERFETAEEFLLALERGAHRPLATPRRRPLLQRNPSLALKVFATASAVANLLMLYLWLGR